ncbi:fimbria/pilus outer membrane usher protein [Proteus hauseri]|uniref:fimbria/pilus outer membrane usher protein n=1 Tax=Proteus hauseri TaxID=183417 RepID=UPI003D81C4E0
MNMLISKNMAKIVLLLTMTPCFYAYSVEFNTDILDASDAANIDISQFNSSGYIMPGDYHLTVFSNGERIGPSQKISVFPVEKTASSENIFNTVCIPKNNLELLGLTEEAESKVKVYHEDQCLDLSALTGTNLTLDLPSLALKLTVPQTWLQYSDPSWVPPSRWEEGIVGAFIDYTLSLSGAKYNSGSKSVYASMNGTSGFNMGVWRFRSDYSMSYQKENGGSSDNQESHNFDFNRFYAYRSIKALAATLTMGENYFYSQLFDAWQYTGITLESDDRMLPPKLVGYAPEIVGVAKTNATIIVKSQDRIVLETTVPPGPFRIQTLDSSIQGQLDVTIREDNGEERKFTISTATLPYLTRPGQVRYKLVGGKTRYDDHKLTGDTVIGGEVSYGVSNAWSVYGGSQLSQNYQSIALGIGRDLSMFGALSFDINQSFAKLSDSDKQGRSYRVNYSKSFDEVKTNITFAGYRFTDEDYRTISQTMEERRTGQDAYSPKESYQIYLNKYFDDFSLSLNYQHNTFWNSRSQTQYGVYANTRFSLSKIKIRDINLTLSAFRSQQEGVNDDTLSLYVSVPFDQGGNLTFSEQYTKTDEKGRYNHNVGYSGYDEGLSYSVNAGLTHGQAIDNESSFSGYVSKDTSLANASASASYVPGQYKSLSGSISGGLTGTSHGLVLHQPAYGDTRLLIETPGISGVPIEGESMKTNAFGLAIIPSVTSFRSSSAAIDVSALPENYDAVDTMTDITLTRGAIGYRQMKVIKGYKLFATVKMVDGKHPPFGASIRNKDNVELGIVGDEGVAWVVGVAENDELGVFWGNEKRCTISLPETIDPKTQMLLMPCK